MTKKEARQLIKEALTVNHNIFFEAGRFATDYINNPKRKIKFDDEVAPTKSQGVPMIESITCPLCRSHKVHLTNEPSEYMCYNCLEVFEV